MMEGFHCTTSHKLERYKNTGAILPPVRFWPNYEMAVKWGKKTGRELILKFDVPEIHYPLPDHRPAHWTPNLIKEYDVLTWR